LDSIRFLCALWVFFYHRSAPPLGDGDAHTHFGLMLRALAGNIWVGPAAVIVFFVISGFCIHYPFAHPTRRPNLAEFYIRRFLRLLPPMLAAMVFAHVAGVDLSLLDVSVLWSLVAELIYYLLYPAVRIARFRLGGWAGLIAGAYGAALAVTLGNPGATDYPSFGISQNWLLGLPCWLLGCALAEKVAAPTTIKISPPTIWCLRVGLLGLVISCSLLRFHSPFGQPIGYPWSLNVFAFPATAWLYAEIVYHQSVAPARLLEWAGQWSYSLYLLHVPAAAVFNRMLPDFGSPLVHWLALVGFVFALAYGFYLLVERPSHALARRASQRFRPASGGSAAQ
jgi:peptidoglycan/LPS O-acetylase OafA/YrhL